MFVVLNFSKHVPITKENFYSLLENEREKENDDAKYLVRLIHQLKKDCQKTTLNFLASSNKKESYAEYGVMDSCNKDTEYSNASQCLTVPLYAIPDKLIKSKVSFRVIFIGMYSL